jgi:hypothetical protein
MPDFSEALPKQNHQPSCRFRRAMPSRQPRDRRHSLSQARAARLMGNGVAIPKRLILEIKVFPGSPSRTAAPLAPPITPCVFSNVSTMCERSACSNVTGIDSKFVFRNSCLGQTKSATEAPRTVPCARMTDRSITFCSYEHCQATNAAPERDARVTEATRWETPRR